MTIVEAIKTVLADYSSGLTSKEIYDLIIEQKLYTFGAELPVSVVNSEIRRRCVGLNFPTAYRIKVFKIIGYEGKKPRFALYEDDDMQNGNDTIKESYDQLPEERIITAYKEHLGNIQAQLFDLVINNSPSFFEHLVVDLLLKMGYGYDETSGIVTGKSHDGGIDGVINEDKLGLDLIYIQAKRYNKRNRVGRKEVQAFVGAMESINKGVFITTSGFTKEATDFVERQQKSIKLIDGDLLSSLLVKYQIGINPVQSVSIYKIDSDYFRD